MQSCKAQFEDWKSRALRDKSSKPSKSELKKTQAALKRNLAALQQLAAAQGQTAKQQRTGKRRCRNREEPEKIILRPALDDLVRDFQDTKILNILVRKVEQGIIALRKPPGVWSRTEDYFIEFVKYRQRQRHQQDDGKELVSVLEKVAKVAENGAKDKSKTGFICRFISHLVEHLRRRRDPTYSKTGNFDLEREAKRSDLVPVVICRIVSGLREYKGAEALVVFNALVGG